jgi:hypothetical protein
VVFFHRLGEIRDRTFENQRYRASGLNLAVAAIMVITFGPQSRSSMAFGPSEIPAQHSSPPLRVRFRTDSAMIPIREKGVLVRFGSAFVRVVGFNQILGK